MKDNIEFHNQQLKNSVSIVRQPTILPFVVSLPARTARTRPLSGSHAAHKESASHCLGETLLHAPEFPKSDSWFPVWFPMLRGSDGSADCLGCPLHSFPQCIFDFFVESSFNAIAQ